MKKIFVLMNVVLFLGVLISCSKKQSKEELLEYKLIKSSDLFRQKEYADAMKVCKEVLEFDSKNIIALKRLGSIYYMSDMKDKAKEIWEKVLLLDPLDTEVKEILKTVKPDQ